MDLDVNTTSDTQIRNSSTFGAYFNIVCVIAGIGTLGLPNVLAASGWVSLFFIVLSATIAYYTGNLLIECLYVHPESRLDNFPDVGEAAFGKLGRYVVRVFHYAILLGASCLFIMLVGINLSSVAVHFGFIMPTKLWILISGLVVLVPYSLFKSMREVGFMSIFGAVATLIVIIVSVIVGLLQPPSRNTIAHDIIIWEGVPSALATISFSFGGNVIYPHVEASMRHPKAWRKMFITALTTISSMYLLISIVGYNVYGNTVKAPIMDSLPDELPRVIATLFITLHVIAAAPILLCSFSIDIESAWDIQKLTSGKQFLIRFISRSLTIAILTLIAMYVPFFGSFMTLVGALANCIIVFVVPVVCHLKLFGYKHRPKWEFIWIAVVLFVALTGCILGTVGAIHDLILQFNGERL